MLDGRQRSFGHRDCHGRAGCPTRLSHDPCNVLQFSRRLWHQRNCHSFMLQPIPTNLTITKMLRVTVMLCHALSQHLAVTRSRFLYMQCSDKNSPYCGSGRRRLITRILFPVICSRLPQSLYCPAQGKMMTSPGISPLVLQRATGRRFTADRSRTQ
jgi:hypothetical protein